MKQQVSNVTYTSLGQELNGMTKKILNESEKQILKEYNKMITMGDRLFASSTSFRVPYLTVIVDRTDQLRRRPVKGTKVEEGLWGLQAVICLVLNYDPEKHD